MKERDLVQDVLFGVAVGDALGVPVEFQSRTTISQNPVTDMLAYGTHNQPAGTWSDDSSLTFCLAETLTGKYDLQNLANRFANWKNYAYWTPHGNVFDIGITTAHAIDKLAAGIPPTQAGDDDEGSNGNGSLMRILPLVFYSKDKKIDERFSIIKDVSSLTHAHVRSVIACFIYLEFALELTKDRNKFEAYANTCTAINAFLDETATCTESERKIFKRILAETIFELQENEIHSSGYVLHTLEAALWCILTTDNYKDAVLKAVNLGSDTDTTGAVTGGLAGLLYGWETIPDSWINVLARKADIEDLSIRLNKKIYS
ncbi:ADP-ribosylglycohydrolase family protein [Chitinophagaceae bacterium LWZ2-11]